MKTASELADRALQVARMPYPVPKPVWDALDSLDHSHARAMYLTRKDLGAERNSDVDAAAKLFRSLGYNVTKHKDRPFILIYGITISWDDAVKEKNKGKPISGRGGTRTQRIDGSILL